MSEAILLATTTAQPKTPAKKPARSVRRGRWWEMTLRAINSEETRSRVVTGYRAGGFSLDDLECQRPAQVLLVEVLTRTEDWLEGIKGARRAEERTALRDIRRKLEAAVYP